MKSFSIGLAISALAFSLGVLAAPPAGHSSGVPMMGGMSGSHPGPSRNLPATAAGTTTSAAARNAHEPPQAGSGGRSVNEILTENTKLASRIHDLTGADAQQACSGFSHLGACVSAAHVSKNLGIEFDTLKARLTGSGAQPLGAAIHDLKPQADASSETRKADRQTQDDLNSSGAQ